MPRRSFAATIFWVETDAGVVGIGSGDTMAGFDDYVDLFVGRDPLAIARHARTLETISYHAGRYSGVVAALSGAGPATARLVRSAATARTSALTLGTATGCAIALRRRRGRAS